MGAIVSYKNCQAVEGRCIARYLGWYWVGKAGRIGKKKMCELADEDSLL